MQYSLKELAHFDRCLFPDDLKNTLIELGASTWLAENIRQWHIRHRESGIIGIYQEWIGDKETLAILEKMVENHVTQYRSPTGFGRTNAL